MVMLSLPSIVDPMAQSALIPCEVDLDLSTVRFVIYVANLNILGLRMEILPEIINLYEDEQQHRQQHLTLRPATALAWLQRSGVLLRGNELAIPSLHQLPYYLFLRIDHLQSHVAYLFTNVAHSGYHGFL